MAKSNRWQKWATVALFLILTLISIAAFRSVETLRGDSRTINFAGILRGAGQRLIKQELVHQPNDQLMAELSGIIAEMQGAPGPDGLVVMGDPQVQAALAALAMSWQTLTAEIRSFRAGGSSQALYQCSEEYFRVADNLVFAAQAYSEQKMLRVLQLRPLLVASVAILLLIHLLQLASLLRLQRRHHQLNAVAFVDPLTQLLNRAACSREIERYRSLPELPGLACCFCDLNNLKQTNDSWGHEAGDRLITETGRILQQVSGAFGSVYRNGGDEFVAFFEGFGQPQAEEYCLHLRQRLEEHNLKSDPIKISLAWGLAFSHEVGRGGIDDLLDLADQRMYADKARQKAAASSDQSLRRQ